MQSNGLRKCLPWLLWYVCILHVVWGAMLLFSTAPLRVTAIHNLATIFGTVLHLPPVSLGIILIVSSILACLAFPIGKKHPFGGICLLSLQQLLMLLGGIGAVYVIYTGHWINGNVSDRAFLFSAEMRSIVLAILHTGALLDRHGALRWPRFLRRTTE
jgi:hypothetical protein